MESRIKILRKDRGMTQEILASELGITQQMLSKYEKDISIIKIDILKNIALNFNVTTDYLLGISEYKRCPKDVKKNNYQNNNYCELTQILNELDELDRKLIYVTVKTMRDNNIKRKGR